MNVKFTMRFLEAKTKKRSLFFSLTDKRKKMLVLQER